MLKKEQYCLSTEYEEDQLVWAKIKGFSWWPAIITFKDLERKTRPYTVKFLNDDHDGQVNEQNLRDIADQQCLDEVKKKGSCRRVKLELALVKAYEILNERIQAAEKLNKGEENKEKFIKKKRKSKDEKENETDKKVEEQLEELINEDDNKKENTTSDSESTGNNKLIINPMYIPSKSIHFPLEDDSYPLNDMKNMNFSKENEGLLQQISSLNNYANLELNKIIDSLNKTFTISNSELKSINEKNELKLAIKLLQEYVTVLKIVNSENKLIEFINLISSWLVHSSDDKKDYSDLDRRIQLLVSTIRQEERLFESVKTEMEEKTEKEEKTIMEDKTDMEEKANQIEMIDIKEYNSKIKNPEIVKPNLRLIQFYDFFKSILLDYLEIDSCKIKEISTFDSFYKNVINGNFLYESIQNLNKSNKINEDCKEVNPIEEINKIFNNSVNIFM